MKAYLITTGTLFGLLTIVHLWRVIEEWPHLRTDPWFLIITPMLLCVMGPVDALDTNGGKVFAGIFALYAGGVFLVVGGVLLTPLIHRILHRLHWEDEIRRADRGIV